MQLPFSLKIKLNMGSQIEIGGELIILKSCISLMNYSLRMICFLYLGTHVNFLLSKQSNSKILKEKRLIPVVVDSS